VNQAYKYKEVDGVKYKRCSRCRVFKPFNVEYYKRANDTSLGFAAACKECKNKPRFIHQNFNEEGLLYCRRCEKYKQEVEFYSDKNKNKRNGKSTECKICSKKNHKIYRDTHTGIDIRRHFIKILAGSKVRTLRKKSELFINDLNIEFLLNLYKEQNYKCALSGIHMTCIINAGYHKENVSIDRKDSSIGYTTSNIQLVCVQVNIMKNNLTDLELYDLCKKVITNMTYEKE